jgi:hypothetical protein
LATTSSIDLAKLFGSVAKTMVQNQSSLNAADEYNHDHGDNMVEIFEVITKAMKEKNTATPAQQLAYASQLLEQKTKSGSGKLYAENLRDASAQLGMARKVTPDKAITILQTLLGASGTIPAQNQPQGGSLAGDLLGSLLGGATGSSSGQTAGAGGDLLGSLLGGLTGAGTGTQTGQQQGGIDIGQLLNAGMAFAQSKQSGRSNLDAILNAVVSSSKMNTSTARTQSGTLVANTLLQALSKMTTAK